MKTPLIKYLGFCTILYVENASRSAVFYEELFGEKPTEAMPDFVFFSLKSGANIGLWTRADVTPSTPVAISGSELCFTMADVAAVNATHAEWVKRGVRIVQAPELKDFGTSFVALDADGHRLRVLAMPDAPSA